MTTYKYEDARTNLYDTDVKLNNKHIECISKKQLEKEYPDAKIVGEFCENNKKKQIAMISINNNLYVVSKVKSHSTLLYETKKYIKVGFNEFVGIVQLRVPLLILFGVLISAIIAAGVFAMTLSKEDDNVVLTPDDNAEYVGTIGYSLGGYIVDENDEAIVGAEVELFCGETDLAEMNSNDTGSFMYRNVSNGYYMIVVKYNNKTYTKLVQITNGDQTIKLVIDSESGSSEVQISNTNNDIGVGNIDVEAEETKNDIRVILSAKAKLTDAALATMQDGLKTEDLKHTVYDLTAKVNGEYVNSLNTVLEIPIPFTTSNLDKFAFFRSVNGVGEVLTEVDSRENPVDGTYYIDGNYVVLFTNQMGEYALVSGGTNGKVVTSSTVGFEEYVNIDADGNASFYFYHSSKDGSLNASLDFIVYQDGEEYVIYSTDNIGNGYQITSFTLDANMKAKLPAGNYSGVIRAKYVNTAGAAADTNIDMPVTYIVK